MGSTQCSSPVGVRGPSPRAWGAPGGHRRDRGRRTIPTCVGSTHPRQTRARPTSPDHPHVRGSPAPRDFACDGHPTCVGAPGPTPGPVTGPSPRAWGHTVPSPVSLDGIPTCVGARPADQPSRPPDHPHVRGEHGPRSTNGGGSTGPSPRAWGALLDVSCVGVVEDHPHVRGEHVSVHRLPARTIPVRGGRSSPHALRLGPSPCVGSPTLGVSGRGPSPRAWGALTTTVSGTRTIPTCVGAVNFVERTIPTCVGSTVVSRPPRGGPSPTCVGSTAADIERERGPSPRAWGARQPAALSSTVLRTIPTCVGSTEDDLQF